MGGCGEEEGRKEGGEGRHTVGEVGCVGTEENTEAGAARDEATVWLLVIFASGYRLARLTLLRARRLLSMRSLRKR